MSLPDPLPRHVYQTRAEQVLAYLRERVHEGAWKEAFPAERQLASQLGVGRHTLRAALRTLEKEGVIRERSQRGTLLSSGKPKKRRHDLSVGIIFNQPVKQIRGPGLVYLDELRYFFAQKGIEVVGHYSLYRTKRVSPQFQKMIAGFPHALWILVSPPEVVEHWCRVHRVPMMLVGNRMDEGEIPGVAVDVYGACRHAAGQMIAKGHRHLTMLLPANERGEDLQGRLGFQAGVEESPFSKTITVRFEIHDGTRAGVCHALDRLLALGQPPTAILICRQGHYITAHTYLLQRGIAIPGQLSLVCRDHDPYLGDLMPEPARYRADINRMARSVSRLAYRLIEGKLSRHSPEAVVRVVPDFIRGETLGEAPS